MKDKATPRPWSFIADCRNSIAILDEDGAEVARITDPASDTLGESSWGNARLIITAINSHVAALRLSAAVDTYLQARHNSTGPLDPNVIKAQVELMNCQQTFEKASKG